MIENSSRSENGETIDARQVRYENSHDSDEISLQDIFRSFWPYRWVMTGLTLLAVIAAFSVAGIQYFTQPVTHMMEQKFTLTFQGINSNQYPNGTSFSSEDIISNPVLRSVYEQNNLSEYFDFSEFKSSIIVYQRNDKINLLEKEYNTKLSNTNLKTAERDRLEQEFQAKKKNALVPVYILIFENQSPGIFDFSDEVIGKTLKNILETWAEYAERVRGVTQYDIALISKNVVRKEEIEEENLLVANDMLRTNSNRVISQLKELQEFPGAHTIQTGENGVTIEDLILRLEDVQRFQLNPMTGLIRQAGVTKHKKSAMIYLENRMFNLQLEKEKLGEKVDLFHTALDRYKTSGRSASLSTSGVDKTGTPLYSQKEGGNVTTIPQFGSSFLNSIMELAKESSDAKFRQDMIDRATTEGENQIEKAYEARYYEQLKERINKKKSSEKSQEETDSENDYAFKQVSKVHKKVFEQLMSSIEHMHAIYQKLSKHNLNPDSLVYTIKEPLVVKEVHTLNMKKTAMLSVLAIICFEFILFAGVLLFHGIRRSIAPK